MSSDASELLDQRQPVSSESEQQEVPPQYKNHHRLTVSEKKNFLLVVTLTNGGALKCTVRKCKLKCTRSKQTDIVLSEEGYILTF